LKLPDPGGFGFKERFVPIGIDAGNSFSRASIFIFNYKYLYKTIEVK